MTPSRARVGGALLLAVGAISFAAIFFRLAQPTHPLISSAVRLGIAATLLLPWVVRGVRRGSLPRAHALGAMGAGVMYAVHFGAWVWSLELTLVASSVTLVTATPLGLAAWALLKREDVPSRGVFGALGLAVVGIAMIGWADVQVSGAALVGDALALLGAAAMAVYMVHVRRLGELDVWAFMGAACAVGCATLLIAAWVAGVPLEVASAEAWGYLLLAALVPQLIGHSLLTWSLRHVTPTLAGLATLGEPVGATMLGWWWLGEVPGGLVLAGCAVTLVAVGMALRSRGRS